MEDIRLPITKLERKDKNWAKTFDFIQRRPIELEVGVDEFSRFQDGLTEVHWIFGLHYVFKLKWDSKHKIPVKLKPTSQRGFKLWGNYLYALLELCIQCHASPFTSVSYANAAEWFGKVVWEMKISDLKAARLAKKGLKKESVGEKRELLKKLRRYENPLETMDEQKYPHTCALVEAALTLAEKPSGFCKKYWSPFKKAYAELLQEIERNSAWQTVFEKDGLPCVQAGRGNRILPYPGVKK